MSVSAGCNCRDCLSHTASTVWDCGVEYVIGNRHDGSVCPAEPETYVDQMLLTRLEPIVLIITFGTVTSETTETFLSATGR